MYVYGQRTRERTNETTSASGIERKGEGKRIGEQKIDMDYHLKGSAMPLQLYEAALYRDHFILDADSTGLCLYHLFFCASSVLLPITSSQLG